MTSFSSTHLPTLATSAPTGPLTRFIRKQLFETLSRLQSGRLEMTDPWGTRVFEGATDGPSARIDVHRPEFYAMVGLRGSVGAGESYMAGEWTSPDLVAVIRVMVRNREVLEGLERGLARLAVPALRWYHAARSNTVRGARRNIAAHYDLGNAFFETFLDPTMMYSSAYYPREDATLEEASLAKLDRICKKLALDASDHVIEIGTGWGGFAVHAASRYGCRVTTTTISREQYRRATERVAQAGLENRVKVLLQDYRELEGSFDKLVSIEMIEAVGHRFYDDFFAKCSALLKPHGSALIQAIVIRDVLFETARQRVDFIQRYIFPGSCIPSVAALMRSVARKTDLMLVDLEDITAHYARTLADWRERFLARESDVEALGFDASFRRMWEFYLAYCEGGFAERQIGDVHLHFGKPAWRGVVERG